jgi:hypothetical protein
MIESFPSFPTVAAGFSLRKLKLAATLNVFEENLVFSHFAPETGVPVAISIKPA